MVDHRGIWLRACLLCAGVNGGNAKDDANAMVAAWKVAWKRRTGAAPTACQADAMQHCIGMANLAEKCGASCAVAAGKGYEAYNVLTSGSLKKWSKRDLHNNEQGAQKYGQAADKTACCEGLLKSGKLSDTRDPGEKECE